ncbi:PIG-L family deacetylase [Brevibacterium metallidurans]|uniref:Methyltransferase domain-containing protein n=1 Tax=Brevibacterium metallidurans TaxID=1482676 RepID=A0ABP3CEK6_9MICO
MTFSHLEAGTAEDEWGRAGVRNLPELRLEVPPHGHVVVLLAHPDDEALGCPALLSRLGAAGRPVRILLFTAGEHSHPHSSTHPPERLRAIRLAEFDSALTALGGEVTYEFLDLGDGALRHRDEEILAEVEAATADLPGPLTLVAPYSGDGHGDHEALGAAALEVGHRRQATVVEFPIWYWHWAAPEDRAWRTWEFLPDPTGFDREALWAHYPSQTRPLSDRAGDEAILPPGLLDHFRRGGDTVAVTRFGGGDDAERPAAEVGSVADGHGHTAAEVAAGSTAHDARTAEAVFDRVHSQRPDPWNVRSSDYEIAKRRALIAALPPGPYAHILEIGCSIGELSRDLATVGGRVTAIDASSEALAQARGRHGGTGIDFVHGTIPGTWPEGRFDCVVLSETGYYLSPTQLEQTLDRIEASTRDEFVLVLCHWTGAIEDWPLDAEAVHARSLARWPDALRLHHSVGDYRLDVLGVSRTGVPRAAVTDVAETRAEVSHAAREGEEQGLR